MSRFGHVLFVLAALLLVGGCKKGQVEDKNLPIVVYYALPG